MKLTLPAASAAVAQQALAKRLPAAKAQAPAPVAKPQAKAAPAVQAEAKPPKPAKAKPLAESKPEVEPKPPTPPLQGDRKTPNLHAGVQYDRTLSSRNRQRHHPHQRIPALIWTWARSVCPRQMNLLGDRTGLLKRQWLHFFKVF